MLSIKLEDYDKWGRNDKLGSLEIYLDELWEIKNQWGISGLYQIQGDELKNKLSV